MEVNDVKFQIAELLETNFTALIKKAEKIHGPCHGPLKNALIRAFWKQYSPPQHWNNHLEEFRVINNAVYYVLQWRFQKTFITSFNLTTVAGRLGKKGHIRFKKWMQNHS